MTKSAVVTISPDGGNDVWYASWFNFSMFAVHQTKTEIDLRLEDGSRTISLFGEHLTYKNGYLTNGTFTGFEVQVNGVEYARGTGIDLAFHDIKVDLTDLNGRLILTSLLQGSERHVGSNEGDCLYGVFGHDTLLGKGGLDVLVSGAIDTTMTGGRGPDWFIFTGGKGKEVVTDFDANGGEGHQDHLSYDEDLGTPRIYQAHDNTVLDFGQHYKAILLGVDRADITADDFKPMPDLSLLG